MNLNFLFLALVPFNFHYVQEFNPVDKPVPWFWGFVIVWGFCSFIFGVGVFNSTHSYVSVCACVVFLDGVPKLRDWLWFQIEQFLSLDAQNGTR